MKRVNLMVVPLGTFVRGRPSGEAREGYEYTDLTAQVVYRNGPINRVAILFASGNVEHFHTGDFIGKIVRKPKKWPDSLENWKSREREFHIKTFHHEGLRPFDFCPETDDQYLTV